MLNFTLKIKLIDPENHLKEFKLEKPKSVSRKIVLKDSYESSGAFYLPKFSSNPFTHESGFIGDMNEGGSCNVNILSFSPHAFTHIETASHVTNNNDLSLTINELNPKLLNNIVYLVDCTSNDAIKDNLLDWEYLESKLDLLDFVPPILAIKTKASILSENYDFSGKQFFALGETVTKNLRNKFSQIRVLILDLPSTDEESDSQLLGHKAWLLKEKNIENHPFPHEDQRAIIELAYFDKIGENYYFATITPAKVETDAMITDILFWEMIQD